MVKKLLALWEEQGGGFEVNRGNDVGGTCDNKCSSLLAATNEVFKLIGPAALTDVWTDGLEAFSVVIIDELVGTVTADGWVFESTLESKVDEIGVVVTTTGNFGSTTSRTLISWTVSDRTTVKELVVDVSLISFLVGDRLNSQLSSDQAWTCENSCCFEELGEVTRLFVSGTREVDFAWTELEWESM